ncbi:hypothetical protein LCGC14_1424430 [marine sediment metagenome]|uniref:Uncharacterized protein n=1 Tax=marine sediment metagenome TaxID=412755 RepID=A0A0F9MS42_9ZZZZ
MSANGNGKGEAEPTRTVVVMCVTCEARAGLSAPTDEDLAKLLMWAWLRHRCGTLSGDGTPIWESAEEPK